MRRLTIWGVLLAGLLFLSPCALGGEPATATSQPASGPSSRLALEPIRVGDTQVFYPDLKPKGLEGVGLTQADVDRAVLKGRKFLLESIQARLADKGPWSFSERDILVCCALIHAGALQGDPAFARYAHRLLREIRVKDIGTNYVAGLTMMVGESMDDTEAVGCRMALAHILESQGPKGLWSYRPADAKGVTRILEAIKPPAEPQGPFRVVGGRPVGTGGEGLRRTTPPEAGADGDNSVTQFAVLGLWSATRAGQAVNAEIWKRCLAATRQRQCRNGSCDYTNGPNGYGSMTCAFLCTSAICLDQLGADPRQDAAIHRALAWLIQNWSVEKNPGKGDGHLYYYLYSVERVGRILDMDFIGPNEWYPQGAKFLLGAQKPNGSWVGKGLGEDPPLSTSFALLFLTKATAALGHGSGPGTLKTAGPAPEENKLYVILDASNSMNGEIEGKAKFQIVQEAVEALVNGLPAKTPIALRVYGNRMQEAPGGVDEDSTLEIPMGPLDKKAFVKKVKDLYARGKTPLAFSLEKAAEDLTRAGASLGKPASVILLTDGWESTAKNRDPLAAARKLAEVEGAGLHVVAFDIQAKEEKAQLMAIAKAGDGRYWEVGKGAALAEKLHAAAKEPPAQFVVLDASGAKAASGPFGKETPLPEGRYTFKTTVDGKPVSLEFWINAGRTTSLLYNAVKPGR